MQYQTNYNYAAQTSQEIDWHYKDHLQEIVEEFAPSALDIQILFVQSSFYDIKERTTKSGKVIPATIGEKVNITFEVLNGKYKEHWYRVQLWGARKLENGQWSRNPEELQEFLEIATRMNPHCLEEKREQTNKFGKRQALYPFFTGMTFKMLIATLGVDDKGYRQDMFKFFSPDKTSGAEYVLGKDDKMRDYTMFGKQLKSEYEAYRASYQNAEQPTEQAQPYGQEPSQEYTQEPEQDESEVNSDELPF